MAVPIELTTGRSTNLSARRRIAAIAGLLAADFAVIGMRQYGVISRLPDIPVGPFDSNAVITSPAAYPFGIPDSALAVTGLGAIIAIATARGAHRARWFDVLLSVAVATGVAGATHYLYEMVVRQRRLCAYCLAGVVGFYAMVPALHNVWQGDEP